MPERVRLVQVPLPTTLTAGEVLRAAQADPRPFALTGRWAGGCALVGFGPLVVLSDGDDPFDALDLQPALIDETPKGAVGGGWIGYMGYQLATALERLPPSPPPGPVEAGRARLCFYDHLLRPTTGQRAGGSSRRCGLRASRRACAKGWTTGLGASPGPQRRGASTGSGPSARSPAPKPTCWRWPGRSSTSVPGTPTRSTSVSDCWPSSAGTHSSCGATAAKRWPRPTAHTSGTPTWRWPASPPSCSSAGLRLGSRPPRSKEQRRRSAGLVAPPRQRSA